MRLRALFIASILIAAFAVLGDDTAALLEKQTQEMCNAVAVGDARVWDRYLDDRVVIRTEDGMLHDKAGTLKDLQPLPAGVSGRIVVVYFVARVHNDTAVTTYTLDEHENYHGHSLHCRYLATDTWMKTPSGWRLVASQVDAERGDPPGVAMTDAQAEAYAGKYSLSADITYEIRRNGKNLEGRRGTGAWEPLLLEAPDVLFVSGKPRYRKIILRDASGKITGFADRREEWDLVWNRIG